jgi:hypothetical protein
VELYRKRGSRHDEAWALSHYAAAIAARGDLPRAAALYQQALTMNRELNKPRSPGGAGLRSKYFRSSGCGMRSEWRVSAGPLGLLA